MAAAGNNTGLDGPGNTSDEPTTVCLTGLGGLAASPCSCGDYLAGRPPVVFVAVAESVGTMARFVDSANSIERCLIISTRCMISSFSSGVRNAVTD